MAFGDFLGACDVVARAILGGEVTYTPGAGSPVVVSGLFDSSYVKVDAGNAGISSTGPAVWLVLSDLSSDPGVDLAATVTIDGVTYRPHEVQPDSSGTVLLLLHKV